MEKYKINNISEKDILKYFIFLLIIILIPFFFYVILPVTHSKDTIHVLFTRYKEPDMTELLKPFINKKNITVYIYNKGDDIPKGIPNNAFNIIIINIPNLGWDAYGYVYHIINNYNNLPTYVANLHASAQYLQHKYELYLEITNIITNKNNKNKFYGGKVDITSLQFQLEDWTATLDINKNTENKYIKSSIFPLHKWIESKIKNIPNKVKIGENDLHCNYFGQFLVHKSRILLYPISFYKDILEEISVWQSEVNHYLERSWYTFYSE
jgi:hypothetical protein